MAENVAIVGTGNSLSVGSRISWAAIFGGAVLALALYFMFLLLGSAVGLTISDRVNPASLKTAAIVWSLLTLCIALFVGGIVTSHFTVGESKTEAIVYGVLMWALLVGLMIVLGTLGIRAGFSAMMGMANLSRDASSPNWEALARTAGVPGEQIDAWRKSASQRPDQGTEPISRSELEDSATRITWYTFLAMWVSMLAAGAGAWTGAGQTFRVSVRAVQAGTLAQRLHS
jgi:hypothetical protein